MSLCTPSSYVLEQDARGLMENAQSQTRSPEDLKDFTVASKQLKLAKPELTLSQVLGSTLTTLGSCFLGYGKYTPQLWIILKHKEIKLRSLA